MPHIHAPEIKRRAEAGESQRAIARSLGLAPSTVRLALRSAAPVAPAKVIRTPAAAPRRMQGPYTWDLQRIREARDEQLRGRFELPVRMAEAMRADDAIFSAYQTRVAPQIAINLAWEPAKTERGIEACERAKKLIHLPQVVRQSLLGTMANHGIAIGYAPPSAVDTAEGPSLTMTLTEWPLEFVRYDVTTKRLLTRVDGGLEDVEITHGENGWVVFRKFGINPWTQDAAILPAALLWPAHSSAISDWAGASYAHGSAKLVGELPPNTRLEKPDGSGELSAEAAAMLEMLVQLAAGDAAAGVSPAGGKVNWLSNGSTAWQVFERLSANRESAAARIYLGTDATLGSRGGAPGVDVGALFGVATTRIQGDIEALERGYREGLIHPWVKAHGYLLADAPAAAYEMPDVDADKRSEQESAAIERLDKSVAALKSVGVNITQDVIDRLCEVLGVSVKCELATQETKTVPLQLAPTDIARVVRVREARAAQGLPPLGDDRDDMTISQLEAQTNAQAQAAASAARAPSNSAEPASDPSTPPKVDESESEEVAE